MPRKEHIYIRLDNIERYLAELAKFHADAGRPAHVAGVRSALAKIRREVARSDRGKPALCGNTESTDAEKCSAIIESLQK